MTFFHGACYNQDMSNPLAFLQQQNTPTDDHPFTASMQTRYRDRLRALAETRQGGPSRHNQLIAIAEYAIRAEVSFQQFSDDVEAAMTRPLQPFELENTWEHKLLQVQEDMALAAAGEGHKIKQKKRTPHTKPKPRDEVFTGEMDLWDLLAESPIPVGGLGPSAQVALFLDTRFEPRDLIYIGGSMVGGEAQRQAMRTRDEWLELFSSPPRDWAPLDLSYMVANPFTGEKSQRPDGKWSYRKDEHVAKCRYCLFEADPGEEEDVERSLREQADLLYRKREKWKIMVITYSGGKSLHALCAVPAGTWDKGVKRGIFRDFLAHHGDQANSNPSRLTRTPGMMRRGKDGRSLPGPVIQKLLWLR